MKTKRLNIRKPNVNDILCYKEIQNSDFVLKYNPMSLKNEERIKREFEENEDMLLLENEVNKVIGAVFLDEDSLRFWDKSIEISFFLKEEYSNNGYMYEALQKVLEYIFTEKQMKSVTARAFAENIYSIKLLKKLGFKQDGYLRNAIMHNNILWDDTLFSLTESEFYYHKT